MENNIKERAFRKFPSMDNPNWCFNYEALRDDYINACEEQRLIDIERACDAYCKTLWSCANDCPVEKRKDCVAYTAFRKALES